MKSVALFYGHVPGDSGDIAITRDAVDRVREMFPGASIKAVLLDAERSRDIASTLESLGRDIAIDVIHMAATPRQESDYAADPARLLEDCRCGDVDLVLLAGGEYSFGDTTSPDSYTRFWRTLPALAASASGKPCVLMPSPFGSFRGPEPEEWPRNDRASAEQFDEQLSAAPVRADLEEDVRRYAKRIAALEMQVDRIENSIAFRLGSSLLDAVKSPRKTLKLPTVLRSLHRQYRVGSRTLPTSSDACLNDRDVETMLRRFRAYGLGETVNFVKRLSSDRGVSHRDAFLAAARAMAENGHQDAELHLVREAISEEESDVALRALYWSAYRRGDYLLAWKTLRRIELLYGDHPTEVEAAFLEKLRRGPPYQLSLLELVPDTPVRTLAPVASRVAYILHNSLPYSSGGYATRSHGLAQGLAAAGFEPVMLTRPGFPLDVKPELSRSRIPLKETVEGLEHHRRLSPLRSGVPAREYMMQAADVLTEELADIRPGAVVAASNHMTSLPALIAARRLGLPFFYEIRGFWEITRISREPEFEETAAFKVQEVLESEVAKRADHVFTLTGPMRGELIRRGVPEDNITLLPNSCEAARFVPRERDEALAAKLGIPQGVPVIGYVGTFVQYEGLDLLVQAAADLRDRGHAFRLLLVGNENASGQDVGPITAEMTSIARERGLDEWLIMPGRVPYEEVEAYYSLIDVAPFPRKGQPVTELVSPMKPLEALAMEKAVVVSSVAALAEMIEHERTGLIFEKDNVGDLADTLERLIHDPELRARLGLEGRHWVEANRTWDRTAQVAADRVRKILQQDIE